MDEVPARRQALVDLIDLQAPIDASIRALSALPRGMTPEVVVGARQIVRLLEKFLADDVSAHEVERWAGLADQIQEVVIEAQWSLGLNPVAWPECPTHRTHPLEAAAHNNEATWACPKDETVRFRIGSLM